MQSFSEMVQTFVFLWAVIDPIGTVPVFLSVTARHPEQEKVAIAWHACVIAAGLLIFFIVVGEILLQAMGVPLAAFQVAGGIVLFLFALTMIFGESKPEEEIRMLRKGTDTAIFPLAMPSIASPGAIMGVVLLTDNSRHSILDQAVTTVIMLIIIAATLGLLLIAGRIHRLIGDSGASIISRVMGLILASIAATSVLEGIRTYFPALAGGEI